LAKWIVLDNINEISAGQFQWLENNPAGKALSQRARIKRGLKCSLLNGHIGNLSETVPASRCPAAWMSVSSLLPKIKLQGFGAHHAETSQFLHTKINNNRM
jgi:hypothetical protein